jgi:hypothetical protein
MIGNKTLWRRALINAFTLRMGTHNMNTTACGPSGNVANQQRICQTSQPLPTWLAAWASSTVRRVFEQQHTCSAHRTSCHSAAEEAAVCAQIALQLRYCAATVVSVIARRDRKNQSLGAPRRGKGSCPKITTLTSRAAS